MVYGYKIIDGLIQPVGASDTQERLLKALAMANISTEGIVFTDTEPLQANGKYFLSEADEEYQALKAEEEAEAERIAQLPTDTERIEALEAENSAMNDMMLSLVEVIDSL